MRTLTKKQIEIINYLLINNNLFHDNYKAMTNKYCDTEYLFIYFEMIRKERELIKLLELDKELENSIEEWLSERDINIPENGILLGVFNELNDDNYAFYRLLARLRYQVMKQDKRNRFDINFIDNEVLHIFNGLSSSSSLNPLLYKELEEAAFNSLIDSPAAELKVTLNSFRPVKEIDDCIDFISEGDILETLLMNYDVVKQFEKLSFRKSSDALMVREIRFLKKFPIIIGEINQITSFYRDEEDLKNSLEFIILLERLKAILITLKHKERQLCYDKILNSSLFSLDTPCYDYIISSLKNVFSEVEDSCKRVRYITMCPQGRGYHGN